MLSCVCQCYINSVHMPTMHVHNHSTFNEVEPVQDNSYLYTLLHMAVGFNQQHRLTVGAHTCYVESHVARPAYYTLGLQLTQNGTRAGL